MLESRTACVTGATGLVGRRIVRNLLQKNFQVRALSRSSNKLDPRVKVFQGDLESFETLASFLNGAEYVFHCAAEINDEKKMLKVNVEGTQSICELVKEFSVKFFCYMSSAGVVGKTNQAWVDEKSPCDPQNEYEKTKWAAEQIAMQPIEGCRTVVFRPTNVFDEASYGALEVALNDSLASRLKVFLRGGECAHLVHAESVASAAMHAIDVSPEMSGCYFVGDDEDSLNTVAHLRSLILNIRKQKNLDRHIAVPHLPVWAPYILRKMAGRQSNLGSVRYSSQKLLKTGFKSPLSIVESVQQIAQFRI